MWIVIKRPVRIWLGLHRYGGGVRRVVVTGERLLQRAGRWESWKRFELLWCSEMVQKRVERYNCCTIRRRINPCIVILEIHNTDKKVVAVFTHEINRTVFISRRRVYIPSAPKNTNETCRGRFYILHSATAQLIRRLLNRYYL